MAFPPAIEAALRAGDRITAGRLARAEARDSRDADLLHLAAYHCIQNEELDEALALLGRASSIAPHDAGILNSLGNVYRRRGEVDRAVGVFRQVCEREPNNTAARFNLARLLEDMGENTDAKAQYEAVIARAPADAEALSRLFYLAAVEGNYNEAEAYGQRAVGFNGAELVFGQLSSIALQRADYAAARRFGEQAVAANPAPRAITTLAHAEFRDGDAERARKRLEQLIAGELAPEDRAFALSLLGDIADSLEQTDEAFDYYAKANTVFGDLHAPQFARPGQRSAQMLVEDLHAFFSDHGAQFSSARSGASAERGPLKGHVFLVGFPRSGTTLLEQSLALHPQIETLDETGRLMEMSAPLWSTREGLQAFAAADEAELAKFRDLYWQDVHRVASDLDGKVLIDKMPLNCLLLPHIERLFPDAKLIFALRDPRDVVLSCFRTRFVTTAFMYEFRTLAGAAGFYDSVMSLCALYRRIVSLPIIETRYEAMVRDFEAGLRALCEFLEIAPVEAMMQPERRARSRMVNTPSGAQIARGLYDGSGQWRRFERHLAGVRPILDPWARRFGYSAD
jgi:tetratricopeptide (TPR) repeat protein